MFPKIPLLQRYIFGEVLRVFLFVLGCLTVLLMFVGVFQQATASGLDPSSALKILPYIVPNMLPFTIPAALLLTVSVVYGRLSGDQEITAAKAAGIHPVSLMWPSFFLGGILSLGSLLLTDQVVPWSMAKIEQQIMSMMEKIFLDKLATDYQFSYPQYGLHVTVAGVQDNKLIRPVFRYSRKGTPVTLHAKEATINLDVEEQQLVLKLRDAITELPSGDRYTLRGEDGIPIRLDRKEPTPKPRNLPISSIDDEIHTIDSEREDLAMRRAIDACFSLTTADFPRLVDTQKKREAQITSQDGRRNRLNTEMHYRYAMACSCFFFSLLGTPFSMRFGKSQYLTNFLLCFMPIVCGYYPLMLGVITQAKNGLIAPEWSVWIANVIVAILAWMMIKRVVRY